jgi:hypothetical protein
MLLRELDGAVLAIGQPSHAWISGQLARSWGNDRFGTVSPYEEVCLGAEQHDIGMARWDLQPSRNPDTGLPHSFIEMPIRVHLELWRAAPRRLLRQSRYAALLVAMHGRRLYEMRDLEKLPPPEREEVRSFLEEQRRLERELIGSLRQDPRTAWSAGHELVARNSQLIWTWDFLSLAVCLDWAPTTARSVPSAEEPVDVEVTSGDRGETLIVDPWPFHAEAVTLRCEGQRLAGRFDSDDAMSAGLSAAPWQTIEFELRPR